MICLDRNCFCKEGLRHGAARSSATLMSGFSVALDKARLRRNPNSLKGADGRSLYVCVCVFFAVGEEGAEALHRIYFCVCACASTSPPGAHKTHPSSQACLTSPAEGRQRGMPTIEAIVSFNMSTVAMREEAPQISEIVC